MHQEPQSAASPSEPDLERDIHYALSAESLQWHARDGKPESLCWPIFSQFRMLLLPMGLLLIFAIILYIPMPRYASASIGVVAAVVILTPIVLRGRREKQENERLKSEFPAKSDQRYRMRVSGPAARLRKLIEAMAKETDEFEPRVFRVGRARRRGLVDGLVVVVLFMAILGGLALLRKTTGLDAGFMGQVLVFASLMLTFVIWAFLWPTYLRLVPGRLDILNYSILGRGRPTVRSIDLHSARVLIMIPGSALLFLPDNPRAHVLDVGPVVDSEPLSFERALLAAARSEALPPQLPENDLVG